MAFMLTARAGRAQDGGASGAAPETPGGPATPGEASGGSTGASPTGVGPAAPAAAEATSTATGGGLFESGGDAASGAPRETATASPTFPFVLSGYVRGDVFAGKTPDASAATMKAAYGELALTVRTAKSRVADGFAEARVRYGLQGHTQATVIDLREAYANVYLGPLDFRLGQQIIVWGRADALNPTNNLTPVDFRIRSPLEDDIRRGNIGARAFLRLPAPFRLEGVWMPVYLATELPDVGLPQFVSFGSPKYPAPDLRNGLGAGRLHVEHAAFEASVSYLYGYAPLPGLTLSSLTFDPATPSVVVARTAYNQHVVGADFSTAVGDIMTIRGEGAFRRPVDYRDRAYAARPDVQWAVGADHNFGSLSVIAQYLGRYVFDWAKERGPGMQLDPAVLKMNPDPTANPDIAFWRDAATTAIDAQLAKTSQILFSQTARWQHLATLRLEWLFAHEALSLSSLALFNFTTHELLLTPRIGYRLNDTATLYAGAQIFLGPDDTLFGLVDQELSAGYLELRAAF